MNTSIRLSAFAGLLSFLAPDLPAQPAEFVAIAPTQYVVTDAATRTPLTVQVSGFVIGRTEVTQSQFESVMGRNPAHFPGPMRPVENVSWWDAINYCNARSLKERLEPCYDLASGACDFSKLGYRLPTEAEWNVAAADVKREVFKSPGEFANLGIDSATDSDELLRLITGKGTTTVGSFKPNSHGLYDMIGNVWEWCQDYYGADADQPNPLVNPTGPREGVSRLVRGGSFVSRRRIFTNTPSEYERGSCAPEATSMFTGFRVVRSLAQRGRIAPPPNPQWAEPFNRIPAGLDGLGPLRSMLVQPDGKSITDLAQWQDERRRLRAKWMKLLGAPSIEIPKPTVKLIKTVEEDFYTGRLLYLEVEPGEWMKIYVMIPRQPIKYPTPAVICSYYDVDTPAGLDLGGRAFHDITELRGFSHDMVRQGFISVAVQFFGLKQEGLDEAVARLKLRHPQCTGLGKWIWDAQRLVDYLYTLPEVDHANIGIVGHSLGAMMARYAAAMDDRITVNVQSEGSISLNWSNFSDYWYFGQYIRDFAKTSDQQELLALLAPRPTLLIAGEWGDGDRSWPYVNAGREVYGLLGRAKNIGLFNHRSGHPPNPEAFELIRRWLSHFLLDDPAAKSGLLTPLAAADKNAATESIARVDEVVIPRSKLLAQESSELQDLAGWGNRIAPPVLEQYRRTLPERTKEKLVSRSLLETAAAKRSPAGNSAAASLSRDETLAVLDACGLGDQYARSDESDALAALGRLLQAEFGDKCTVTKAEIEEYYRQHIGDFTVPEELKVAGILVKPGSGARAGDGSAADEKARAKITMLAGRLKTGADFAALSKEFSDDLAVGKLGGTMHQRLRRGQSVPAFEAAAFALKVGETSEVIRTEFGYHLIKLLGKTDAQTDPLEQVGARIATLIREKKLRELGRDYLASLRAHAAIRMMD